MNIHIDINTKKVIDDHIIFSSLFGSRTYYNHDYTSTSDSDIICIYTPSTIEQNTVFYTNHQLQYNDDIRNIDYVYTNYHQFIKNIISGDATLNIEVVFKSMKDTCFDFLYQNRFELLHNKLFKCYLGMARRDLKEASKSDNYMKKINHANRGYLFAKQLMENPESFDCKYQLLEHMDYKESSLFCGDLMNKINDLREKINHEHKIEPSFMKRLDEFVISLPKPEWDLDYSKQYYHINNNITY